MIRRVFNWVILMLLVAFVSCSKSEKRMDSLSLHRSIITIDSHLDTPLNLLRDGFDISDSAAKVNGKLDLPKMQKGGLDAAFLAVFVSQMPRTEENTQHSYEKAHQIIDSVLMVTERYNNEVELGLKAEDIERVNALNKKTFFMGMENGFPIGKELNRVEEFYNRGIRYITLSHSLNNDICDSSTDSIEHDGLSNFGVEVVKEMNRLGMMVDVSHISDAAFFDVLEETSTPIIASHSSVRSICNHPRNLSDTMLMALAANGGVIQICLLSDYIVDADTTTENYRLMQELKEKYNNYRFKDAEEQKRAWAEWYAINENYPVELASIEQAVDHIDYVVNLIGIDHVGIGSDFDGGGELSNCMDVSQFPLITDELLKRGYLKEDIEKIWGANFLRVFAEVEKYAITQS